MPNYKRILPLIVTLALSLFALTASAQSTAFTYQGRLDVNGTAASGTYDLSFALFNAASGGAQQGSSQNNPATSVSNGLFTVTLDFGNQFPGAARWLEIAVRTNGGGSFTVLTPRQALTATPYAVQAANAVTAAAAGSVAAANISGVLNLPQLPPSIVTAGESGVALSGSFTGNGGSLTNVDLFEANNRGAIVWNTQLGNFIAVPPVEVGPNPWSIAVADVNEDGKVDVVMAGPDASYLVVTTNNGAGTFSVAGHVALSSPPIAVTAADVNSDGKMDLISAHYSPGSLSVLTNQGGGVFIVSSTNSVAGSPFSITSGDVNGDGLPDVICDAEANTLAVFTNNGTGGMSLATMPAVGNDPSCVVTADVNNDGKLDVISANKTGNSLSVLTNRGFGGFTLAVEVPIYSSPYTVVAADFNGDGRVDLAAACNGTNRLAVVTNNGSAGFTFMASPIVYDSMVYLATADLNRDKMPDLIYCSSTSINIGILTNNGTGGFSAASDATIDGPMYSLATADVNGDGNVDLISGVEYVFGCLNIRLNPLTFTSRFIGNGSGLTALNATNLIGTIASSNIADGSIGTTQIADGSIVNADVNAAAAIAYSKLNLVGSIGNADINAAATIADTKLATISTAGKVSDSALSANVALLNRANQTFTGSNTFSGMFLGSAPYLKFAEVQPVGINAGANIAGVNIRKFTEVTDTHTLGATNANGDIVLPAGTYQCRISAPGYRVNSHQARLTVTNAPATALLYGTTEYSDNALSPGVQSRSLIEGQFVITNSANTLQVQHYMGFVRNPNGLGVAASPSWPDGSPVEVYAVAEFWKIK